MKIWTNIIHYFPTIFYTHFQIVFDSSFRMKEINNLRNASQNRNLCFPEAYNFTNPFSI